MREKYLILASLLLSSTSVFAQQEEEVLAQCSKSRSTVNTWAVPGPDKSPIPFPTVLPGLRAKAAAKECAKMYAKLLLRDLCSQRNELIDLKKVEYIYSCAEVESNKENFIKYECFAKGIGTCTE